MKAATSWPICVRFMIVKLMYPRLLIQETHITCWPPEGNNYSYLKYASSSPSFWRISLFLTDYAIAKLYVMYNKVSSNIGNLSKIVSPRAKQLHYQLNFLAVYGRKGDN